MAGHFKNPIVGQLWAARQEAKERQLQKGQEGQEPPTDQPKTPSQSMTEISYPFSKDNYLLEAYQNPWGFIRMGRVLEDLDAMAGNVAFHHVVGFPVIVTAGVDRIRLRQHPLVTNQSDMTLIGKVTWVGTSSMEIRMQLSLEQEEEWLEAYFTFVTLDPETRKPARVPPLLPETNEERAQFELGALKAKNKKMARRTQKAAAAGQPQTDQSIKIDELAASLMEKAGPLIRMPSLANPHSILMRDTQVQNAEMAQPQVRNLHGRIFGGYLMRRAFELAFANAYMFGGAKPSFLEVDDISFDLPVDVGDLLVFSSRVLYTRPEGANLGSYMGHYHPNQPLLMIEVEVWVTEPESTRARVSNTLHFNFSLPENTPCRTVLPGNIDEARRMATRMIAEKEHADLRT